MHFWLLYTSERRKSESKAAEIIPSALCLKNPSYWAIFGSCWWENNTNLSVNRKSSEQWKWLPKRSLALVLPAAFDLWKVPPLHLLILASSRSYPGIDHFPKKLYHICPTFSVRPYPWTNTQRNLFNASQQTLQILRFELKKHEPSLAEDFFRAGSTE